MTKEELAKWLHDNYEAIAKEQNWDTQQRCKVEFDALPDANKRTMIEIADRLLNFNLLRLHFVVGRSEQLKAFVTEVSKGFDDSHKHKVVKKANDILKSL